MAAGHASRRLPDLTDLDTIARAAAHGLKPNRPLQDPIRLFRVAAGMIVAAVAGHFLHDMEAQNLLCVGAFLGGIAALMPYHRGRILAAAVTGAAEVLAALVGIALHDTWWILLPLLAVGFFTGGLLRVVGVGLSMRVLVVTIVMIAFAEITPSVQAGTRELALFSGGVAIMLACQLLPPFEPRHLVQRRAVADLYDALAAGGPYGPALMAADSSLALVRRTRDPQIARLTHMTEQAEQIGQLLHAMDNRATPVHGRAELSHRLTAVARNVRRKRIRDIGSTLTSAEAGAESDDALWAALRRAVDRAEELAAGTPAEQILADRRPPTPLELVRNELHPGAPMFRHAVRLAVAGVLGELVGRAIGVLAGPDLLPAHGFWVCLTVVLILFPDYGEASSRGIARTAGTVIGALAGAALSFLPGDPVLHTLLLIGLLLGYLIFRSCGQPWTMMWVVMWISVLSTGPLGAVTRGLDAVVGAVLALMVYLLFPTWQRERLGALLTGWLRAQAEYIAVRYRTCDPGDAHSTAVARAAVRSRLTRLEFLEAGRQAHGEPPSKVGEWDDDDLEHVSRGVYEVARQCAVVTVLEPDIAATRETPPAAIQLAKQLQKLAADIDDGDIPAAANRQRTVAAAGSDIGAAVTAAASAVDDLTRSVRDALSPKLSGGENRTR